MSEGGSSHHDGSRNEFYSFQQSSSGDHLQQLEGSTENEKPLTNNYHLMKRYSTASIFDDTPLGYAQLETPEENSIESSDQWDLNYHEASIYLEEGENNDKFTFHPRSRAALPAYNLVHNQVFYCFDLFASIALLSLALTEKPAVPGFAVPEWIHASVELLCLLLMCVELCMKVRWMGSQAFLHHKRSVIKLIVLVIMIIEAVVVLGRQTSHFRVTRALRPVFLIDNHYCKGIRRVIRQIMQSLPPILDMLTLLLFFMLIFSVLGFYLFRSVHEDTYFSSLQDSFVSLFVLLTTANFPDVMMPSYAMTKWSSLFFIIFIIIHVYFLMNLMLAVVYETFTRIEKDKFRKLLLHRRKACQLAFRLLVTKNSPLQMSFRHFEGLMKYFKPRNRKLDNYLMFKTLDTKKTGYLTMSEFLNVFEAGPLKWKPKRPDDLWFAHFQGISLKFFTGINKLVTHHMTDLIINAVVAINGVWQIMEASEVFGTQSRDTYYEECDAVSCETTEDIYGWVSIAFVAFYTVEVSLKIIGLGVIEYFSSKWNRFDFGVTFLAICGLIAEQFRFPFSFVTILRTLRLLRLFKLKKRYRDVLGTLFIILPRFLSVAFVLVILYYFFGIIAMEVLSGYNLVNCCVNTTVEQFYHFDNDTSLDGYYYLNNFDDFITSQITLFELMVVNNWFIIMNGYASVATEWSRLFFMSFYIVTMVVINIVVAFVLEAFLFRIQYKRYAGDMDKESLVRVDIGLNQQEIDFCQASKTYLSKSQLMAFANDQVSDQVIFRGTRTRTKFSFSLKMYAEEVKKWLTEADNEEQRQREMLLNQLQQEQLIQSNMSNEDLHDRTFTV
ncbi:two pore calcium channel protein 1 [Caerostris darwini]|uniref:Two pore calcium channel protein 1 n=2 Tax=Caerostris TaxID=172845 RepID=A0AAV4MZ36_9ARAC|nr:two pore calcium channel protein 1 [Caerostris darwini]